MQKQEECREDARIYHAIHNRQTISEKESPENNSEPYQQSQIPRIRILKVQREMPLPDTSEVRNKDEKQTEGTDRQWKQMEQSREEEEIQEVYQKMANDRKGTWRTAEMLNSALTKTILVDRLGYPSMSAHYLKIRVND